MVTLLFLVLFMKTLIKIFLKEKQLFEFYKRKYQILPLLQNICNSLIFFNLEFQIV